MGPHVVQHPLGICRDNSFWSSGASLSITIYQGRCKWRHTEETQRNTAATLISAQLAALLCTAAACIGTLITGLNFVRQHRACLRPEQHTGCRASIYAHQKSQNCSHTSHHVMPRAANPAKAGSGAVAARSASATPAASVRRHQARSVGKADARGTLEYEKGARFMVDCARTQGGAVRSLDKSSECLHAVTCSGCHAGRRARWF